MAIDRRGLVKAALGAAAIAALPGRAVASVENANLFKLARRELERNGSRVWVKDKVGIADFSRPSREPRFFILDMAAGTVSSFLVAHGRGSDPEHDGWLKTFSNAQGSLATSRGAYLTRTWYQGKYGTSMRLWGLDPDNNQAEDRAIVLHGAWYANPEMVSEWGKLGRSEGCFAVPESALMEVIGRMGPGRLLFADRI
jgi:L,D-transpeptidase catalytic domain